MRNFWRALYTQFKISTFQDRILRAHEGSRLLSKARYSTRIPANSVFFLAVVLSGTSGRRSVSYTPEGSSWPSRKNKENFKSFLLPLFILIAGAINHNINITIFVYFPAQRLKRMFFHLNLNERWIYFEGLK